MWLDHSVIPLAWVSVGPDVLVGGSFAPPSPATPSSKLTNEPIVGTPSDVLISTLLLTDSTATCLTSATTAVEEKMVMAQIYPHSQAHVERTDTSLAISAK